MNLSSPLKHLVSVERWTLLCSAVLITLSFLFLGPRGQLGVCAGAGLMALNARLLRIVGNRLHRRDQGQPLSLGLLLVLFNGKLLGLAVLIYLCIRYLKVEPLPFLLGISVLPLAIVLSALGRGLFEPPAPGGEG